MMSGWYASFLKFPRQGLKEKMLWIILLYTLASLSSEQGKDSLLYLQCALPCSLSYLVNPIWTVKYLSTERIWCRACDVEHSCVIQIVVHIQNRYLGQVNIILLCWTSLPCHWALMQGYLCVCVYVCAHACMCVHTYECEWEWEM